MLRKRNQEFQIKSWFHAIIRCFRKSHFIVVNFFWIDYIPIIFYFYSTVTVFHSLLFSKYYLHISLHFFSLPLTSLHWSRRQTRVVESTGKCFTDATLLMFLKCSPQTSSAPPSAYDAFRSFASKKRLNVCWFILLREPLKVLCRALNIVTLLDRLQVEPI